MTAAVRATWVAQLMAAADARPAEEPRPPRFNPRPKGVIQPGRSTDVVLRFLEQHRPRLFTRAEIIQATGCTQKSVTWAVYYLVEIRMVRSLPDVSRNERYKRYGAAPATPAEDRD